MSPAFVAYGIVELTYNNISLTYCFEALYQILM